MTTEFVWVLADWTVGQTLELIRNVGGGKEAIYTICVLDPETNVLRAVVPLRRLITGQLDVPVLSAALPYTPLTVSPLTDREDVARLISKYDLLAIPVVDETGHVLGIVTVDDVIEPSRPNPPRISRSSVVSRRSMVPTLRSVSRP